MAAVIAVGLSSCSKNEIAIDESSSNAVSFSPYTEISTTKGEITGTTILKQGFGLFAYDQGTADFANVTLKPNYMYNTEVSYSGGWSYSPIRYWSNDASNQYSFFAYAPYNGDVDDNTYVLSTNAQTGTPKITYKMAASSADMIDFVAGQTMDITKYGDPDVQKSSTTGDPAVVSLNLKHQLTRATFYAKTGIANEDGADQTFVNITNFQILGSGSYSSYNNALSADSCYFFNKATYTFATTTTDDEITEHDQDGTWSYDTTTANSNASGTAIGAALYSLNFYSLLPSCNVSSDALVYDPTPDSQETDETNDHITSTYTTAGIRIQSTLGAQPMFATDEYLFLIPPRGKEGVYKTVNGVASAYVSDTDTDPIISAPDVLIRVTYDIVTVDEGMDDNCVVSSTGNVATVRIPAGTLKQGYAYRYDLTINGANDPDENGNSESAFDPVEITASVISWDTTDNTSNPVTIL